LRDRHYFLQNRTEKTACLASISYVLRSDAIAGYVSPRTGESGAVGSISCFPECLKTFSCTDNAKIIIGIGQEPVQAAQQPSE
jgi:hypothetical protein